MKKLQPYCFFIFFLFFLSNCYKQKLDNPYGLPNVTQNGSMVFACRINGQDRIAKSDIVSQIGNIATDSVFVGGGFGDVYYYERVGWIIYGNAKLNIPYNLGDSISTAFLYSTDSTCLGIPTLIYVNTATGTITFTKLDSINRIISGVFAFKVPMPNCDTLNFTDGRFDIRY